MIERFRRIKRQGEGIERKFGKIDQAHRSHSVISETTVGRKTAEKETETLTKGEDRQKHARGSSFHLYIRKQEGALTVYQLAWNKNNDGVASGEEGSEREGH